MTDLHPSDSATQRHAEPLIVAAAGRLLGIELMPARIDLGNGLRVEVDGASADRTVLVEA